MQTIGSLKGKKGKVPMLTSNDPEFSQIHKFTWLEMEKNGALCRSHPIPQEAMDISYKKNQLQDDALQECNHSTHQIQDALNIGRTNIVCANIGRTKIGHTKNRKDIYATNKGRTKYRSSSIFTISTAFQNFNQTSQFHMNFKISTDFQNFNRFSKF